ncbi:tetratricopeptide repeat protein [Magnetospirillum sp. UT-4]|uniref:tetratricopeptide repeat protein n=1 Tax=Magnetospirillum sp. UT-4 TaxID=2681467 RepID=UPI001381CA15|nr:tetratricopeptide repeat protein [Magnetospirillum sp. UT-4]CAA7618642.1 TPR repeat-containing protein (modular protein) [Magnetospirillum sp. UT-4]
MTQPPEVDELLGKLDGAFRLAMERFQAGDLDDTVRLCDAVLGVMANHPGALHLKGVILHGRGDAAAARDLIARAVAADSSYAEAWNNLGVIERGLGHIGAAVAAHRRAVDLNPGHLRGLVNLSTALSEAGDQTAAIDAARRAVALAPQAAEAHNALGLALRRAGDTPRALEALRTAVLYDPASAAVHINLGNALLQDGQSEEAELSFRRALILDPDDPQAHNNIGSILITRGRFAEAAELLQRASGRHPAIADLAGNLGVAQARLGRIAAAADSFRRAAALAPDHAEMYSNLGAALQLRGDLGPALVALAAGVLLSRGAARAKPFSNLLYALNFVTGPDGAGLGAERLGRLHRVWDAVMSVSARPHVVPAVSGRRLRIGLVSADFASHPVGFFTLAWFRHADCGAFEIVAYHDRAGGDAITAELKAQAGSWVECFGWSDDRLEAQIRADGIDILIDLAGHTADNRLPVFAAKPAPVQASWAGYVGTTGLAAMDWVIADANHMPEAEDGFLVERVMRLPHDYIAYAPPDTLPAVGPLPAARDGAVTFGSFNNLAKLTPPTVALWSRVLAAVPGSRLLLKTRGLDDAGIAERVRADFAAHGIDPARLLLEGGVPHGELLEAYNRVDIALDPVPYAGGLTTCEALWMGVPVVTLRGNSFAGRHSAGHLTAAGLPDWIAEDGEGFVARAVALAGDLDGLAAIRAGLRARVASSPLGDGPAFARHFDAALRRMWDGRADRKVPDTAPLAPPRRPAVVVAGAIGPHLAQDIALQSADCLAISAPNWAEGAARAREQGADALLFAPAAARLLPDHLGRLIEAGTPVATTGRLLLEAGGSADPEADGDEFAPPECILLRGPALELAGLWAKLPAALSDVADRAFWHAVRASGLERRHVAGASAAVPAAAPLDGARCRAVADAVAGGREDADPWLACVFPGGWPSAPTAP